MMRMRVWMVVMVFFGVAASADEKDHNGAQHQALCGLLKAAVTKWGEVRGREPADPLRKALGQTIFGKVEGGDLSVLKVLPTDYNNVEGRLTSRGTWCGQPFYETHTAHGWRWSGHSAPHDLVCLCTLGNNTWPLNHTQKETTLCGKDGNALGGSDGKGWSNGGSGNEHVKATWVKVTVPCLNGEAGGDLKQALNEFLGKLQHKPDGDINPSRYILGENNVTETDSDACTGSPKLGVCVSYFNATSPMPWWVALRNALPEEEKFQEEKRREEERRKKQEEEQNQEFPKAEALRSGSPTTKQTEQSHKDNITDKLRRYNLTSGTPISQPSSWLFSVAILI
ncbi:Variant surface glycoprotein [Trypanosoma congolense IL3000]|uniref:Variant surface glycoprotein n=1 Tax=Trypanosoma congolense (strain IL3000) TaxID=1068625 RepID=F9W7U4_TRYCI|nr:Variant surface glycoprotein [Trypanosoma congolense IL3000]